MKELIPTGVLRVGVAFAPQPTPLFVVKNKDGTPRGITGTTTIRAAARSLTKTTITAAQSIGEAVEMLTGGKADAFALSRDSLPPFVASLPGSRIVEGGFQLTGVAIAVPRARPDALA